MMTCFRHCRARARFSPFWLTLCAMLVLLLLVQLVGYYLERGSKTSTVVSGRPLSDSQLKRSAVDVTRKGERTPPTGSEVTRPASLKERFDNNSTSISSFLGERARVTNDKPFIVAKTRGIKRVPSFYISLHPPDIDQVVTKEILSTGHLDGQMVSKILMIMEGCLDPGNQYFVDVGAHIGFLALSVAMCGYKTIAFEPLPHNHALLEESIKLNELDRDLIETFNLALGNDTATCCMSVDKTNQAFSRIEAGSSKTDCKTHMYKTSMKRLDDIIPDKNICLLNIDTEGYAPSIIYGASRLITGINPPKYIHFLLTKGRTQKELGLDLVKFFTWLKKAGYEITISRYGLLKDIEGYVKASLSGTPRYVTAEYTKYGDTGNS